MEEFQVPLMDLLSLSLSLLTKASEVMPLTCQIQTLVFKNSLMVFSLSKSQYLSLQLITLYGFLGSQVSFFAFILCLYTLLDCARIHGSMAHEVLFSFTLSALYITKMMGYSLKFRAHLILKCVNVKLH